MPPERVSAPRLGVRCVLSTLRANNNLDHELDILFLHQMIALGDTSRPRHTAIFLFFLSVFLLGTSCPSDAHNGAVALASPVAGITIDGNLSDWPAGLPRYSINHPDYGRIPTGPTDLSATFRVAYSPTDTLLYVAIESLDESHHANDGTGVYLDFEHPEIGREVSQYYVYGNRNYIGKGESEDDIQVVRVVSGDTLRCEWAFKLGRLADSPIGPLPGTVIGFDVIAVDEDGDEFPSWVAWGRGKDKYHRSERRGDLVFMAPGQTPSVIRGRLEWSDGEGIQYGLARVRWPGLTSTPITVEANASGSIQTELPARDDYLVALSGPGDSPWSRLSPGEAFQLRNTTSPGTEMETSRARVVQSGIGLREGLWHSVSVADGLSAPFVSDITQDARDGIWIGTQAGAARYDGASFIVYNTDTGLPGQDITAIHHRPDGEVWLATRENGVARMRLDTEFQPVSITAFGTRDGLDDLRVWDIHEDSDGTLWFATDGGLTRFGGERFHSFDGPGGEVTLVSDIDEGRSGDFWLATWNGPVRYSDGRFTRYPGLDQRLMTIHAADDGVVWCGAVDGIYRLIPKGVDGAQIERFEQLTDDANGAEAIFPDRSGDIWISSGFVAKREQTGNGVFRWDGREISHYTDLDGLAGNQILDIFEDSLGRLWFGTASGGVSRYDASYIRTYTQSDGIASNDVRETYPDRSGRIWVATGGGLNLIFGDQIRAFTTAQGLADDDVHTVLEDSAGNYWVGTTRGISRIAPDLKTVHTFGTSEGADSWSVLAILEDRSGAIWFGTGASAGTGGNGLVKYLDGRFTVYTEADGLLHRRVTDLLEDGKGGIWLTTDTGICHFDGQAFVTLKHQGEQYLPFRKMLETADGRIWLAPDINYWTVWGVSTFDPREEPPSAEFVNFGEDLPDGRVRTLMQDSKGHIWMGTDSGVSRFDGRVVQHLYRTDGLPNHEVRHLSESEDGSIWISTAGGLARYQPDRSDLDVRVTGVLGDRQYLPREDLQLPSSQTTLAFEFSADRFVSRRESIVYRYRLEGHQDEWQTTRSRRVEFHDLSPGPYVFEIESYDIDLNRAVPTVLS